MKYKIIIIMMMILSISGCTKNKDNKSNNTENKPIDSSTIYLKERGVWAYKNEDDLDKDFKVIDKNNKEYFEFGNKFTLLKSKKGPKNNYYKIKLPDANEFWLQSDFVTEKFIVINKNDVATYTQPDQDYKTSIKVEPGDYGIFIKEQGEWVLVDFYAFRPSKKEGERVWVGQKWINEGYTTDLTTAKEAYFLYFAYYNTFIQKIKNKDRALDYAKKALEANHGEESEISFVVKNFISELESGKYF